MFSNGIKEYKKEGNRRQASKSASSSKSRSRIPGRNVYLWRPSIQHCTQQSNNLNPLNIYTLVLISISYMPQNPWVRSIAIVMELRMEVGMAIGMAGGMGLGIGVEMGRNVRIKKERGYVCNVSL